MTVEKVFVKNENNKISENSDGHQVELQNYHIKCFDIDQPSPICSQSHSSESLEDTRFFRQNYQSPEISDPKLKKKEFKHLDKMSGNVIKNHINGHKNIKSQQYNKFYKYKDEYPGEPKIIKKVKVDEQDQISTISRSESHQKISLNFNLDDQRIEHR